MLEFARKGLEDLHLIKEYGWPFQLGLGVIDVKTPTVETPELVAERIRRAIEYVDPARPAWSTVPTAETATSRT